MNTKTLIRISGMVLLALAVSLVTMALIYTLQHPQILTLGTIGWNGTVSY